MLIPILLLGICAICIFALFFHKVPKNNLSTPKVTKYVHHSTTTETDDPELFAMERQSKIEDIAGDIRIVIVCFVDGLQKPYPYSLKKDLPLLKESHRKVLLAYNTIIYASAVKYAYHDMFTGQLRIQGRKVEYKKFFEEYTNNPAVLDLTRIRDNMPERYLIDFDMQLFSLNI